MELKGWIARDRCGVLCLYDENPERNEPQQFFLALHYIELPINSFPEVTWENSPVEVTIKIEKV